MNEHEDTWKRMASCHGKTAIFFAPHRERPAARVIREAQALLICASCPVRQPCRAHAQNEFGIWAGEKEDTFVTPASLRQDL